MKGRRWVRFSLRGLLGTIMLLCGIFGAWTACEHRAITDVKRASGGWTPQVVAPYVLSVQKSNNVTLVTTYHAWCFGLICDLPYSRQFPVSDGVVLGGVRPVVIIQEDEPESLGFPEY